MTRIIVRNLPDQITKEKLHELFSEKGTVTDIQLKFTKSGKFRKFAFIGFQKQEYADAAINTLNKTYINTSRIEIEQCKGLADPEKPRSWSKHSVDSSAYPEKKRTDCNENGNEGEIKKKKIDKQKKIKDPKLESLLEEYKDDVMFKEFIEAQMPDDKTLMQFTENKQENVVEEDKTKLADKSISDLEYLKLKTGQVLLSVGKVKEEDGTKNKVKKPKQIKLFTVKIVGLPIRMKKSEIKAFLGVKPFTIRRACGQRGVIFVGFKEEHGMKKALYKHRGFFSGKRILVREVKNAEDFVGSVKTERWKEQEEKIKNEDSIGESGRIFVRNLPYVVSEDEIKELFEKYGPISEIVLPIDSFTRKPKGFCTITFVMPEHAAKAFSELDGTVFQGRMLHLLPGIDNIKNEEEEDEGDSCYKFKKLRRDKKNAGCSKNWNTFFVSENALAAAMAEEYNTSKENVLNEGGNVAVRLALGETQIINKMKEFLEENGVCLDSFSINSDCKRSNRVILVKNLPFGTKVDEIREKFAEFGELQRVVLPPHGITGIVEFIEPSEAKKAFRKLAYTKFKNIPLYLEWAPEKTFKNNLVPNKNGKEDEKDIKGNGESMSEKPDDEANDKVTFGADYIPLEASQPEGTTIFLKNLNFMTNEDALQKHFSKCGKILSVSIAKKPDPKQPGKKLSAGYGFIQFSSKEEADNALKTLQFSKLDDYSLELKRSNRVTKPELSTVRKFQSNQCKPSTKIIVKNVPFQAKEKEVLSLFKVFGEVKSVRMPKKMVGTGSHRGFCFIEFYVIHDAKRAFNALSQSTHLYGRRLVLEWASEDDDIDTLRKKTAERFKTDKKSKKTLSMEDEAAAYHDSE